MLLRLEFAKAIGGFRDDYFIDSVDHEFCLRAAKRGQDNDYENPIDDTSNWDPSRRQ